MPDTFGVSRKQIIRAFYAVRRKHAVRGSELYRLIARKIGYKTDKNGDNAHIRRVVNEYLEFLEELQTTV